MTAPGPRMEGESMLRVFDPNPESVVRVNRCRALIAARRRGGLVLNLPVSPAESHRVRSQSGIDRVGGVDVATIASEILSQMRSAGLLQSEPDPEHRIITPVLQNGAHSGMTLREWYQSTLAEERERRVGRGKNKSGTAEKDLSALSYWERMTDNPPLADIGTTTTEQFIANSLESGRRSTARGYCGHIRWMLNEAKRAGLIERTPEFQFPKASRRAAHQEEFRETLIYEIDGDLLATLGRIHDALPTEEIKLAFCCGASFGPRTEDLLMLPWSAFELQAERPVVRFVAEKTGTFHVVPLAPWLVQRLSAARIDETHVFPTLISHANSDPRKSRQCRATVEALREAARSVGFNFGGRAKREQKPFQVLRATCNERFERHSRRAGEWILGHAMTGVNRKSYQNPASAIYEAVLTLPQPSQFLPRQ